MINIKEVVFGKNQDKEVISNLLKKSKLIYKECMQSKMTKDKIIGHIYSIKILFEEVNSIIGKEKISLDYGRNKELYDSLFAFGPLINNIFDTFLIEDSDLDGNERAAVLVARNELVAEYNLFTRSLNSFNDGMVQGMGSAIKAIGTGIAIGMTASFVTKGAKKIYDFFKK